MSGDQLREAEIVDLLTTRALWCRADAATTRAAMPAWGFSGGVLRPALAALIWDYDLNQPDGPPGGTERVAAICSWVQARAGDVAAAAAARADWQYARRRGGPDTEVLDPYLDAATSLHAVRDGLPDPLLLRHAAQVLSILPALVAPDAHTTATTGQLLEQLHRLRAANLADAPA
ncbi:hypothetical protein [Cellulomonas hominis]|uniref:hypothetical protein n=1 Tax=Cellulomonas hominis TaxID=156981 RepID=UPI001BA1D0E1|nr:hypothetical protein [Cellulomonas hominis]VTR76051.1 hypothetical protein CHMI_00807 [Cellulomonas hominis]